MKYLLLTLLLGSCSLAKYPLKRDYEPKRVITHTERLEACVFRLIERDGVKAVEAKDVCSAIFRRE